MGNEDQAAPWRAAMDVIHTGVMRRGWSEEPGAFRQPYEADTLGAAALLIPVMRFSPAKHPWSG